MNRLTIITVNRNNAKGFIRTYESVISQNFPYVEYIVIDGNSTDDSKDLIIQYQDKIDYWISEPDKGIYHAMNKGIQAATGDYVLFLNSGDHFVNEHTLTQASEFLGKEDIIYGNILLKEGENKSWTGHYPEVLLFQHFVEGSLPHPASFIRKNLFEKVGLYDESLKICADWKFFLEAVCRHNVSYKHILQTISVFYNDGLSSRPESQDIISVEKKLVLNQQYPAYMPLYNEYKRLKDADNKRSQNLAKHILKKVARKLKFAFSG